MFRSLAVWFRSRLPYGNAQIVVYIYICFPIFNSANSEVINNLKNSTDI